MSGDPGCGSTSRTVAWSVNVSYKARHCCLVTALSMRRRLPCIQGLMMYATVKYSGGHIRNKCRPTSQPIGQVALDVFHVLETHREPHQARSEERRVGKEGRSGWAVVQ